MTEKHYMLTLGKPTLFGKPRNLTSDEFYDVVVSLGFEKQADEKLQGSRSSGSLPGGHYHFQEFFHSSINPEGNSFAINFDSSQIRISGPKARNPVQILGALSGKYNVLDSYFNQSNSPDTLQGGRE
jgi:hypothetical protein